MFIFRDWMGWDHFKNPIQSPNCSLIFFKRYFCFKQKYFNPLTTGVENECWLRGMSHFWPVQKWVLTTGNGDFGSPPTSWQTWFDWPSDKLSHIWFKLFLKKVKMTKAGFERAPIDYGIRRFCPLSQIATLRSTDWIL